MTSHLDKESVRGHHAEVANPDEHDVAAILAGVFDVNARLGAINREVRAIRMILENGDEEEEEEEPGDPEP